MSQLITKSLFIKTKLNPLYQKLNLLKLINIFKQEILKFMYKYQNKSLPKCFFDFFAMFSKLHFYPTRFATCSNYSVMRVNKAISQRSIRYLGPKLWNELPTETKNRARNNKTAFIKSVKEFLHLKQIQINCFTTSKFLRLFLCFRIFTLVSSTLQCTFLFLNMLHTLFLLLLHRHFLQVLIKLHYYVEPCAIHKRMFSYFDYC